MKYEVQIKVSGIEELELDQFQSLLKNIPLCLDGAIKIEEGIYYEVEEE
jgi:hypothetical protein